MKLFKLIFILIFISTSTSCDEKTSDSQTQSFNSPSEQFFYLCHYYIPNSGSDQESNEKVPSALFQNYDECNEVLSNTTIGVACPEYDKNGNELVKQCGCLSTSKENYKSSKCIPSYDLK